MIQFEFPRISQDLITSLLDTLQRGHSVTILGGRNVGKRYIIRQLYDRLAKAAKAAHKQPADALAVAAFLERSADKEPHHNQEDQFLGDLTILNTPDEVADWWQRCHPVANLLIANLDALPAQESIDLITRLRSISWGGLLVTGEAQSLPHSRTDDGLLRSDRMLAVSCFRKEEFGEFVTRYLNCLRWSGNNIEERIEDLYQRTGGNIYVLRVLLWAAFDAWAEKEGDEPQWVNLETLPDEAVAAQLPWNHYLRYVTRLLGNEPKMWPRLEQLLKQGSVPAAEKVPDLLELTGIPVRDEKTNELRINTRVLKGFLQRHYTEQKFADLYAGNGDWKGAFECLEKVPAEKRVRPFNLDDVPDASFMVKRLASSLHEEARYGLVAVEERFRQGCLLILGFSEVTFWMRPPRVGAGWQGLRTPEEPPEWLQLVLGEQPREVVEPGKKTFYLYPVPTKRQRNSLVAVIPPPHPDCTAAVAVCDDLATHPQSQARIELLRDLIRGFQGAYSHALEIDRFKRQAEHRQQFGDAVTDVFNALGWEILTVREAVERTVRTLHQNLRGSAPNARHYRFVLVSLLDPERKRIKGFFEASDDPDQTNRFATDYSVDPPEKSIHVAALLEGKSILVPDFPSEERAYQPAVEKGHLRSGAVVLLDTGRKSSPDGPPVALGTLLAEREDGLPVEPAELEDLERFGRKLAGVIEQSERTQLLAAALDLQREPLAILDAGSRLRYANIRAAAKFGVPFAPSGWRKLESSPPLGWEESKDPTIGQRVLNCARSTHQVKNRTVALVHATSPDDPPATWAVLADMINEEKARDPGTTEEEQDKDPVVGAFLESQDLSFFDQLFGKLPSLLSPERLWPCSPEPGAVAGPNPTERLIEEIGKLFSAGREAPAADYDAYDPAAGRFVRQWRYERGNPPAPHPTGFTYPAIGHAVTCFGAPPTPAVFYFDQGTEFTDGQQVITAQGLIATSIRHPLGQPEQLPNGALWIDFPICAGSRKLGKFVFTCQEDFPPEDFVLLKTGLDVLCGIVGATFELAARYEQAAKEQLREREEAAQKAVRSFIHNLKTPLNTVDDVLQRYRDLTPSDNPLLRRNHDRVTDMLHRFRHRAKLASQVVDMKLITPLRKDLLKLLNETLSEAAPSGCYTLSPTSVDYNSTAEIDGEHLALALSELVENSRKYCPQGTTLHVTLAWHFDQRDGREWVFLSYEDNGAGIKALERTRLFQLDGAFHRDSVGLGTGLGLHYVKQVVAGHGGHIEEVGRGAQSGVRFLIEFPRFQSTNP